MRRRYRPQIIGIRPEWIYKYILIPLMIILSMAILIAIAKTEYTSYAKEQEEKKIAESIQRKKEANEMAKILQEKELKRARIEREREISESIKNIEIETRKTNTLYENQVSKKVLPVGTYLRNSKLNKVGRVVGYYGLEVITNNEWNIEIDTNGNIPEYITIIGYAEYIKTLKKQKEIELQKQKKANANKIQELINTEIAEETKKVKKMYEPYNHIELDGTKYFVADIVGHELMCIKKGQRNKKSNYIKIDAYNERIKKINYREYEIIKGE